MSCAIVPMLRRLHSSGLCRKPVLLATMLAATSPVLAGSPGHSSAIESHEASYPKIMGMYIGGPKYYSQPDRQRDFSRHDFVILGFYRGWGKNASGPSMRDVVRTMKRLNPQMLVGQYTVLQEVQDDPSHPSAPKAVKVEKEGWWLADERGRRTRWIETYGAWDVNITHWTKVDRNGDRYPEWLAGYDNETFFRRIPELDIWYFDNALSRPATKSADWNRDGKRDSRNDPLIEQAYRRANVAHWTAARKLQPDILLVGNTDSASSDEYRGQLNGIFMEAMIGKIWSTEFRLGWAGMMDRYRAAMEDSAFPHLVGFNVHGAKDDYQRMRYGLTSCLMGDGYFSYTEADSSYRTVAWFDEFDVDLGRPVDSPPENAWSRGVFRRTFERGLVLVNPGIQAASVTIEAGYSRIKGTQDPRVNTGEVAKVIRLAPKDGIILLRNDLPSAGGMSKN